MTRGQGSQELDRITYEGPLVAYVAYGPEDALEFRKLPDGTIFAIPAAGEKLYRYIAADAEAPEGLLSRAELGRRPFKTEHPLLHPGVSMFATVDQVLSRFRRSPRTVFAVTLEADLGFYVAKTVGPGHYTVWGDPDSLAARAMLVYED